MKYTINEGSFPYVVCDLEPGEQMITESGAMSWMSPNIEMNTTGGGGVGKMFGRALSGESLFLNTYTARSAGFIAFSSTFPGRIIPLNISPGTEYIVQKSGFLAAENSVELNIFFRKKLGAGFFGGEGFIMQKLSGNGTAFVEIDGDIVEYELKAGEELLIDTGYLAMMEGTVSMDIRQNKGVKNVLFGGEGLFNTVVTGPGKVWIQSHPVSVVAGRILTYLPTK